MVDGSEDRYGNNHDLLIYRVGQLERAVDQIAKSTAELSEFVVSLKAQMRVLTFVWGLAGLVFVGVMVTALSTLFFGK